jgi:alginate O-acetyltransferase complex protein AlgJ
MVMEKDRSGQPLTREEAARIEVGRTKVTPAVTRALVLVFAAALAVAPVLEWTGRVWRADTAYASAWSRLAGLPSTLSEAWTVTGSEPDAGVWDRLIGANRAALEALDAFETELEDESVIGGALRPPAQLGLSRWLGAGNERVYVGREGWLFFRPDVEYVTGPGFLDPATLARRAATAPEWATPPTPDPREAIGDFQKQLAARGIVLVVMPTPLKPTVHPERLAGHAGDWRTPIENPSYAAFVESLRRDGVLVFDPSAPLLSARQQESGPLYLARDTHWRPEAMERVARALARVLETQAGLPPTPNPGYRTDQVEWRYTGDLAQMLDLPAGQTFLAPETVVLRRVLGPDGEPWRPSRSADVLVLGDSFCNIYSLASMGWGDSAGFVEQLSEALGRPIDRIVQNDDGAFATRAMLQRDLARGVDRLAGTRVVVLQFAARELAFGDWRRLRLPPG